MDIEIKMAKKKKTEIIKKKNCTSKSLMEKVKIVVHNWNILQYPRRNAYIVYNLLYKMYLITYLRFYSLLRGKVLFYSKTRSILHLYQW